MRYSLVLIFLSISFSFSDLAKAQFKGCHQYCGRECNDEWNRVMASVPPGVTGSELARYKAKADAAKENKYKQCMAQTLAEGKRSDADCNNDPASATPTANPNRCVQEYENLLSQCDGAMNTAVRSCDSNSNSGLNNAATKAASTDTSTSGVPDSCSGAQSVVSSAKDAWTLFRDDCSNSIGTCQTQCDALVKWANANPTCLPLTSKGVNVDKNTLASQIYSPRASKCLDLQSEVDKANSTISSYGKTADGAGNCKDQTSGGTGDENSGILEQLGGLASSLMGSASGQTASPTAVASFCSANPSYPGCGASAEASCSNPAFAATNKVCQCAADPSSCRQETNSANSNSFSSNNSSSSRIDNSKASIDGESPSVPSIPMGGPAGSGEAASIDGRQGAGASIGGGGGGSGTGGGSNRGNPNVDPNHEGDAVSSGTYGGAGSMARSAAGVGTPTRSLQGASGGSVTGVNQNPDLRKFLPGGSYNPYPTAVGGRVGIDGITGPNSDIWLKVQNRYQVLKETLQP